MLKKIIFVYITVLLVFASLAKANEDENDAIQESEQMNTTSEASNTATTPPTPAVESKVVEKVETPKSQPKVESSKSKTVEPLEIDDITDIDNEKTDNTEVNSTNNNVKTNIKKSPPPKKIKKTTTSAKKTKPVKKASSKKKTKKSVAKKSSKTKQVDYMKANQIEDYVLRVGANGNTFCSGFVVGKKVALAPYPCFNFIKKNGYKIEAYNQKNEKFQKVNFLNLATNLKLGFASQWVLLITEKEVTQKKFLPSYDKSLDNNFLKNNDLFMAGVVKVNNGVAIEGAYGCKLNPASIYKRGDKIRTALLVKCNGAKDKNMYIGAGLLGINKHNKKIQLLGIKMDTRKDKKTNSYYSIILPTSAINAVKENMEKQEQRKKILEL